MSKTYDVLSLEYDQAWNHFRHIETQRMQYLGFFFTVSLGSAALALPTVTSGDASSDGGLLAVHGFVATYFVLTVFVWISVRRNGRVLAHYDRCLRTLRSALEEVGDVPDHYRGVLTVDMPYVRGLRGVGLQTSAERILAGFAVAGAAVSGAMFVVTVRETRSVWLCIAAGIASTCVLSAVALMLRPVPSPGRRRS